MHTALILVWAGTMSLFELSHFIPEKPLYEQGFILLPHLFELGGNLYSHFIISILHLISAGILALGGIYHAIVGAERLEETSFSALFAYGLQDRFRITAILGSHLLTLGIGAALLFAKAVYLGGLCKHIGLKLSEHHLDWTYLRFNLIFKLGKKEELQSI